jgi:hypothetical protein
MSGLQQRIVDLEAMVGELWSRAEVQRNNEAFTPLSKNPFLRDPVQLKNILSKPLVTNALYGKHRGIVMNTKDPLHKGRVQVYCPSIHANIPEANLPWAEVASFFGSLEDQGSVFTPPAGSTVYVEFEGGSRESPVVSGAVHNMTRQRKASAVEGGMLVSEERNLWGGAPGRRTDAKNTAVNPDLKSLMPPWRGESYDGIDQKPEVGGVASTVPFVYGIKTPEKHFLQFVDGNSQDRLVGKRLVLQSSRGSCLWMKDDSLTTPDEIFNNPNWDDFHDAYPGLRYSAKPYNNHKIELKHTGLQAQSVGGARLIMSDETEIPMTANGWSAGWSPGGRMRSFVVLESITEHQIHLRDHERQPNMRSPEDGIFLLTASGNFMGMRDDTQGSIGGPQRGILLWSTSNHRIEMNDFTVQNASPRSGSGTVGYTQGTHTPNARRAYIRIRSGWGQIMELNDLGSQEENANQYIFIRNNNDTPDDCDGPPWNYIRMECVVSNKLFLMYGAGNFIINVCRNAFRIVQKGNDYVFLERGSHFTISDEGIVFHKAQRGIIEHTISGAIMMLVGRIIDRKLEFPPYPVVIAKNPFVCPFTSHLHYDEPSRHVFASE